MKLFEPLNIRNMTLKNRIAMSPMCMYSCEDDTGLINNWHKTHYASRAVGQVGLIIMEATAITLQGGITNRDVGIWSDEHIPGLKSIVDMVHEQGAKIGIQIAHAGRKSEVDGDIIAPSALPFTDEAKVPQEMTREQIVQTISQFIDGARRAIEAGFDCLEIHGAHGYLINEFLSPLANKRTDEYGGDRDGRFLFLQKVIEGVRAIWDGPLFVRISASDYHDEGTTIEDSVYYAERMKELGVDLIDCSSGGVKPVPIKAYPGYQVQFAREIKEKTKLLTGAVGLITKGEHAEEILQKGQADLILLGRELLRDPYWPLRVAHEHNIEIDVPKQYERAWA